ncbi:MAG TPA: GNAT family N-acetyltransferase [Rhodanobacter sp.]|nr:GNAT family N-acetyltransferase [Rhodanobacter sp.]
MDAASKPDPSRLRLRSARRQDVAEILALIRELAEYEKLLHEVIAGEADLERDLFGATPRAHCDIAEWDGEVAGFALWFYNYSTFMGRAGIYLEDLFVRPAFRGNGIGRSLIAGLARRCVDESLPRLQWSVLDWNQPSIAFYESIGADVMREWLCCRMTGEAVVALAQSISPTSPIE